MYRFFMTTIITALCLTACVCSGGFGSDGPGADELGPGIFGPDTIQE
ncbi:MAG: hypothetical protein LBC59_04520 [Chitinispirillales bacterium]|jgi:hypothetical protein|nr:hypothetical protein [Chitinispirillales bacterium]